MIRISVPALAPRNLKGEKNGRPYDLTFQTVYCHTRDQSGNPLPYPEKSEVRVPKGAQPYAPGEYSLSPDSLYVDRQGNLSLSPKLVPLPAKG